MNVGIIVLKWAIAARSDSQRNQMALNVSNPNELDRRQGRSVGISAGGNNL
jgi:hypothetical protein